MTTQKYKEMINLIADLENIKIQLHNEIKAVEDKTIT